MSKRRRFSAEFKARVALEALSGAHTLAELSAKHDVHPNMISESFGLRAVSTISPDRSMRRGLVSGHPARG